MRIIIQHHLRDRMLALKRVGALTEALLRVESVKRVGFGNFEYAGSVSIVAIFPLLLALGFLQAIRASSRNTPPLAYVEDSGVMLKPVEIPRQLLCDVTLATGRQANHDNDQLGSHIS